MKRIKLVFFLLLTLVLTGCSPSTLLPDHLHFAEEGFHDVFKQSPPATLTDLQGDGTKWGDDEDIYLRFRLDKPAFKVLVRGRVHSISSKKFNEVVQGVTPTWWKPLAGHPSFFEGTSTSLSNPEFGSGNGCISYDPTSQIVYVYSSSSH